MQFSITHAAFEGFRVIKRAPMAVAMWGVTYFAFIALILFAAGAAFAPLMQGMDAGDPDPAAASAMIGSVFMIYLIAIPLSLLAAAIVVAATCRAVLTPDRPGFFYMRLGGAELRLIGSYLIIMIGTIVAFLIIGAAFGMIMGGAFLMGGGMGPDGMAEGGAPPVAVALIYPLYFAVITLFVWMSVRLSLLGPITVAEGRFALGRAWAASKGRFWVLLDLAAAAIARWFILYFVAISLFSVLIILGIGVITGASAMEAGTGNEVFSRLLPLLVVGGVLMAAFAALQFAVLSTPFAVFYRDVIAAKTTEVDPAP